MLGVLLSLKICAPLGAVLPQRMLFRTCGLLLARLDMPPPELLDELLLKVTLVSVGLLAALYIPPPEPLPETSLAVLPLKVVLVSVGLLALVLYIPPPQ